MEDAESIVVSFWGKRDQSVVDGLNRGMLKPSHEITTGARTEITEIGGKATLIISENGAPLSEKTISALEDGGFTI